MEIQWDIISIGNFKTLAEVCYTSTSDIVAARFENGVCNDDLLNDLSYLKLIIDYLDRVIETNYKGVNNLSTFLYTSSKIQSLFEFYCGICTPDISKIYKGTGINYSSEGGDLPSTPPSNITLWFHFNSTATATITIDSSTEGVYTHKYEPTAVLSSLTVDGTPVNIFGTFSIPLVSGNVVVATRETTTTPIGDAYLYGTN